MIHVKVADLPETLINSLKNLGYHKNDIPLEGKEKISPQVPGGKGRRGFCVIVNIATGETKQMMGSWGGSNMFNPNNQVDLDDTPYTIPAGFAVIKGVSGYKGVIATITVPPDNVAKFLPEKKELDPRDKWILYTFSALTSAGRKKEWEREDDIPSEDDLNRLAAEGYLKRSKNGASRITTDGKNAVADRGYNWVSHPNSKYRS